MSEITAWGLSQIIGVTQYVIPEPCYLPSIPQIRDPEHSWLRAGSGPCPCAPGCTRRPWLRPPRRASTPNWRTHIRGRPAAWQDGVCGQRGCPARGRAHLQVGEVPGAVVILAAPPGEPGPEVHLDQLPVRAEADVAEDAGEGRRGRETALVQPAPQAPPSPLRLPPTLSQWVQRSLPCPRRAAPGWTLHWAGQAAGLWASASSVPTTIARYLRLVDGAAVGHPRCPPRTRTRAQWGQEPGPPSVARLVLAELFLRMTRGRVSAFCAVWLLPARVPASVGLSIPGGSCGRNPAPSA